MIQNDEQTGAAIVAPRSERLVSPVVRVFGAVSSLLILTTLFLTLYSIVMRYVFSRPPVWIDEFIGYLLVALIMCGVAEAYRQRDHIAIDLVTAKLGRRGRFAKGVWSDICVFAFALVLGVSSWEAIEFAHMFGSYSSGAIEIQTWIPQVPMLIAATLLGAFAIARLIGRFSKERQT
ncbi:TRAP transporter small permease [Actibacterium lipolyticum]|uniref:TRAP transporter small permease protein n=1 Tax=Actibacterium lipolyticum TaxID=1524263 RepID=A0A238L7V9_9RHOB|nr:TRAP transporter small permease [Actibacterium lipolyticum]SMX51088.1 Tripartite ATP-independent periplasmic transporters, DctQ component [Actibacterium lipolyticum]